MSLGDGKPKSLIDRRLFMLDFYGMPYQISNPIKSVLKPDSWRGAENVDTSHDARINVETNDNMSNDVLDSIVCGR
jgi:hypothetical protein